MESGRWGWRGREGVVGGRERENGGRGEGMEDEDKRRGVRGREGWIVYGVCARVVEERNGCKRCVMDGVVEGIDRRDGWRSGSGAEGRK
jgi:hypothetical protein